MDYSVRTRVLARAFVDAQALALPADAAGRFASEVLPGQFNAVTAIEQGPMGTREAPAFVRERDRLFFLGGASFDYTGLPTDMNGTNLADFAAFAREAAIVLGGSADWFGRRPHRLALVQEGFLRDMSANEMTAIASRLLSLPPRARERDVFEWDWRVATRDCIEIVGSEEECNLLLTVKRVSGVLEAIPGQRRAFDALRVELDVNTTNTNTMGRFDGPRIAAFFERALDLHADLAREADAMVNA